jgi:ABC-type Zn uptake system ZnuABC Zn-binding protein ZnuA
MRNKYIVAFVAIIVLVIIAALFLPSKNTQSTKLKVLATTTQITDFVQNVAQDKVELATVFAPGVDPHEYEPTPEDIIKINSADIIFRNGVDLEKKINKSISDSNKIVVTLSDKLTLREGDPHVWQSVSNAKTMVNEIADTLIKVDPANKGFYDLNRINYISQLNDLDKYIQNKISELPVNNRKLVTNHDAFGYYVDEYKLEFVGSIIPSLSSETEPTATETAALIKRIKEQNVKAIFTETSINPKLSEQIAIEAKVKIVPNLYGDTLGAAGSPGDTYIKMMRFNTDTIVDNLK